MAMIAGKEQYENIKNYYREKSENRSTMLDKHGKKSYVGRKNKGFDGLLELVGQPGIVMTERAKKKFADISMKRAQQNKG
jgi:hypothetical protein